jgi:hypothetical protein
MDGLTVNSSEVLFDNTGGDFTLKLNTNAVGDKNEIIMGDSGTPLAKFGVGGTANDIITGSDGQDFNIGTAGGGRAINFSTDNFASVEMKLDGGNVGIGTSSPTTPLSIRKVHGSGYGSGIDMLDFKAYFPPNYDTETSKASIFVGTSDKHTLNTHGGFLAFKVNSSGYNGANSSTSLVEYMRIEKDGNVGIGTDSPAAVLHISKDVGNTELEALRLSNFDPDKPNGQVGHAVSLSFELPANDGGITDGKLAAKIVGTAGANGTNDWYTGSPSTNFQGQLDFYTRNDDVLTNQMTIDEHGYVGLATTNPNSKLEIFDATGGAGTGLRLNCNNVGSDVWDLYSTSAGRIYVTNPNYSGGVYLQHTATSWTGNSDERLKENIVELDNVLPKISNLRAVKYNFISDEEDTTKIGFIAQDWQTDFSEVVNDIIPEELGMNYTETIPVLLKAIQEQQTIIEDLQARIEILEG